MNQRQTGAEVGRAVLRQPPVLLQPCTTSLNPSVLRLCLDRIQLTVPGSLRVDMSAQNVLYGLGNRRAHSRCRAAGPAHQPRAGSRRSCASKAPLAVHHICSGQRNGMRLSLGAHGAVTFDVGPCHGPTRPLCSCSSGAARPRSRTRLRRCPPVSLGPHPSDDSKPAPAGCIPHAAHNPHP